MELQQRIQHGTVIKADKLKNGIKLITQIPAHILIPTRFFTKKPKVHIGRNAASPIRGDVDTI